jgi:uncharacterized OB-fold protein
MEKEKKQIPIEEGLFTQPDGARPQLIGNRCRLCGLVAFPKTPVCPKCMEKGTMEEALLEGKGKLDSYCIVNAALSGFKMPSIQAVISLNPWRSDEAPPCGGASRERRNKNRERRIYYRGGHDPFREI